ncbi:MAG: pitrilysin family protein [Gemmatimonadales bacterium]|jgi:zinc protease
MITHVRRVTALSLAALATLFVGGVTPLPAQQAAAAAQEIALPDGVTRGASVEGITEYDLANGLQVLLFPDQSKQQITVNITYFVGSRHESYGETGMAHLLEHMLFKGTPEHPNVWKELADHGASPNGTTWFDRTNYFETFPASEKNLDWALDLEASRMVNSFVSREDLDSEMTVVRNEWESGENSPFGVLQERVMSTAYLWHNYGNSTIGARADIENVPIERLQAFYRKYYQPDNAALVVAGRFDPETALQLVAKKFGDIPKPDRTGANQLFTTYTREPAQDGERSVTLRRVGDEQITMAAFHVPAGSAEDFAAVDVLSHILGTEPAGRLYQALDAKGLAASSGASDWQLREPGMLYTWARVREGEPLQPATDAMLAALAAIGSDQPPTEEEVNRAKTDYLKNIELAFNNPQRIGLQLSTWTSMGDWRLFFLYRDRLEKVTPDAVRRVAATYLIPTNRTMGYFYPVDETPVRAEVPPTPDVEQMVAGYTGREAVAQGEAFDPSPGNIDSRTERFTLPNGLELALLPKENRGDAVTMRFTFRMGTEDALTGRAPASGLVAPMLRRGTEAHTRQQLEDELDRLKAQFGMGGGPTSVSGSITTVRGSLPQVVRLVAEMLKTPSFPADEFQTLKEEQLAGIESQMSNPQARAVTAYQRHMNTWPQGHPYYVPTLDERKQQIEDVTLDQVKAFWADFYGAQNGTISIVGDFDPAEMKSVLEEAFGDWDAKQPFERIANPYEDVPAVAQDIETPDKENAMMIAAQPVKMMDTDQDYPAMEIANYMIGGGSMLSSRLATKIRQEEGLSYGVGSSFGAPALDDSGQFLTYAIFAPQNSDAVVAAFREVMEDVVTNGFTQDELEAAKHGWLDSQQNSRANDGTVAGELNSQLYLGRTYDFVENEEDAVRDLTLEEVNSAVSRYLDPDRISIFRAGDFAGVEDTPTS